MGEADGLNSQDFSKGAQAFPSARGRKSCPLNQVVVFTENHCGKESLQNVNMAGMASSFSLLQSRAVDEAQLIRNRCLPRKNHFTSTEYIVIAVENR